MYLLIIWSKQNIILSGTDKSNFQANFSIELQEKCLVLVRESQSKTILGL